jgi:hypothetical protein
VKKWLLAYLVAAILGVQTLCAGSNVTVSAGEAKLTEDGARCVTLLEDCGVRAEAFRSTHFVIVAEKDAEVRAEAIASLEAAYTGFHKSLTADGFAPSKQGGLLTWVFLADGATMDEYADLADRANTSWLDGYYSPRTNRVAMVLAGGVSQDREEDALPGGGAVLGTVQGHGGSDGQFRRMSHEAAHQLSFNCGLLKRGVMYPLWVSEGVSTNFECDGPEAMVFGGANKPRAERLTGLAGAGKLLPLKELVALAQVPACEAGCQDDYYAQAWGLFNFLYNHNRLELKAYLASLAAKRPGRRSSATMMAEFEKAFGPAAELEKSWRAFAAKP